MNRIRFLGTLLVAIFLGCSGHPIHKRDVIVIVMDTTRADRFGIYGNPHAVTPRIDEFSRECEIYDRAWSTASWTLPSHASLLSGRYVSAHGAFMRPGLDGDSLGKNPPRLVDEIDTLAELLGRMGYHTAAFAGAGWLAPEFGLLQGYTIKDAKNLRDIQAEEITKRASAWIDTVPAGEPLHLLLNYFDPHGPYDPPEAFNTSPGAQKKLEPPKKSKNGRTATPEQKAAFLKQLPAWTALTLARYEGEIRYTDHEIGRLLDKLRTTGRYENALIILTSDHGEAFLENGATGHGAWLYETLIHVPLIVHRPGGRNGGRRVDAPVSLVDVLGIVAQETGVELPPGIDSVAIGTRQFVLAEEFPSIVFKKFDAKLDRDLVAGIQWPLKLIVNRPGSPELYDLSTDPHEHTNLADGKREVELAHRIDSVQSRLIPPESSGAPRPMTPESRKRLKALGYIE